jgi:hypothetical protein
MRKTVLLLLSTAVALLVASGAVVALPSERSDKSPMVNGTVRAIEQVGTNIWLGGKFTQVKRHKGTVVANVSNLAVLGSKTKQYTNIAPKLGGTNSEVWDMTTYRGDVLIAGEFSGPSSKENNLVRVDGKTGRVIKWFDAPPLKSVLGVPDLGRVYGGGDSLSAFEFATGKRLWSRAKITVNESLRDRVHEAAYRDLELDGKTIWAACVCDAVNGKPAKALVKLSTEGVHDASWVTKVAKDSFGHEVVDRGRKLYLAAGGSDFLAELDKGAGGKRSWVRDTMGSVQAVAVMDKQVVIGGHFLEVADQPNDYCGHGRSKPELDPNDECRTRKGIAAYSFSGRLDSSWSPTYAGKYSLVGALHVQAARLHTGGEFLTVNGVTQNYYARFTPASLQSAHTSG